MAARTPEDFASQVVTIPRAQFIDDYWTYKAGEHVTILAPSQGGKTELSYALISATAAPDLQAIIFVMKPEDPTVERFIRAHKYPRVSVWPPKPTLTVFRKKPSGYILWPAGNVDPDVENEQQGRVFRNCLRMLYPQRKKKKIVFADELFSLEKELSLSSDINRIYTKGASTGFGLWAASQRPAWISQWAFQAPHLFIGQEPDKKARDRYGEIASGIDPDMIRSIVSKLAPYEFLYIRRSDRTICIVGAS